MEVVKNGLAMSSKSTAALMRNIHRFRMSGEFHDTWKLSVSLISPVHCAALVRKRNGVARLDEVV